MVKTVNVRMFVSYDGGINDTREISVNKIAKTFGAERLGSGCFLMEPYTRDIEFKVAKAKANKMHAALKANGFVCRIDGS